MVDFDSLNKKEKDAICMLINTAKRWPKSLWLFSASGRLHVMKCGKKGEQVQRPPPIRGTDPTYDIMTIDIPNDGGDW